MKTRRCKSVEAILEPGFRNVSVSVSVSVSVCVCVGMERDDDG